MKLKFTILSIIMFCLTLETPLFAMTHMSDRVSTSRPGGMANHEIKFILSKNIPPSGRIEIWPQSGRFFLESGFDYTDIDLAVTDNLVNPYVNRNLFWMPTISDDGVDTLSGTMNDWIKVTLSPASGIVANSYVKIDLGTSTVFGEIGDKKISNYSVPGSYVMEVRTYDENGSLLEKGTMAIGVIEPVRMGTYIPRVLMSGSPYGWLAYGTTQTIMSLITNFPAFCRYATASGTPYDAMTSNFSYLSGERSLYHTVLVSNLQTSRDHTFYVRCDGGGSKDNYSQCIRTIASTSVQVVDGVSTTTTTLSTENEDCLDYEISFSVTSVAGSVGTETGSGSGGTGTGGGNGNTTGSGNVNSGGGSSGGASTGGGGATGGGASGAGASGAGGSGAGGGGSGGGATLGIGNTQGRSSGNYLPYPPLPGQPGVILAGWSYPGSEVVVLKDGKDQGLAKSDLAGKFGGFLENLTKGIYTFSLWSKDSANRQSMTYSTTFWIDDNTQTNVSNIIIAPTIDITVNGKDSLVNVFGQAPPEKEVDAWIYPKQTTKVADTAIIKRKTVSDKNGNWSSSFDTASLAKGDYYIKARVSIDGVGQSDFSQVLTYNTEGVIKPVEECPRADLNHDGKTNLTDFSILLYHWNSANTCADQNKNGKVDLIDFSIMMYYWTG